MIALPVIINNISIVQSSRRLSRLASRNELIKNITIPLRLFVVLPTNGILLRSLDAEDA